MLKWDLVVERPPFVDGDKLTWTDTSEDENVTYEIKVSSLNLASFTIPIKEQTFLGWIRSTPNGVRSQANYPPC